MGLTGSSVGRAASENAVYTRRDGDVVVALAGNPNVGKSSIFNAVTGMRQHTGNWPGKTVSTAYGVCERAGQRLVFVDLPGTYSLGARSREEEIARDFIVSDEADVTVVVCDATCLERSLNLALQCICAAKRAVVCVNLIDEAKKKNISIDAEKLSVMLGVPVICTSARERASVDALISVISLACETVPAKHRCDGCEGCAALAYERAEAVCCECVHAETSPRAARDLRIDRILTGKYTAAPLMILLLAIVFYITLRGANYPSEFLSDLLSSFEAPLLAGLRAIRLPDWICLALTEGMYRILAWVVSVMLPPMAIFFPLFTLLEDLGYLPRVAFNLDKSFAGCSACGKQSLTMCMVDDGMPFT